MKQVIGLSAFIGMTCAALAAAEIGKPAPGFTGTDINGKTHQLSDYQGKVVVLESYNSDCPFSANHYHSGAMQDLQKEMTAKGVVWLLVDSVNSNNFSYRTPEKARAEWQEKKINATAWLDDSSGTIAKAYGMKTTPHMFVIDKKGTLVYDGAIDDRPRPNGDPRTARNYVREAVEKTLAGEKVEVAETKPYGCAVKYGG
ncbi:MAG TPA: thioredoxin family protein [Verrucomicrobiae bacterium]